MLPICDDELEVQKESRPFVVMVLSAVSRYAVLLANTGDQIRVARSYVLECRTNVVRRKAAGG